MRTASLAVFLAPLVLAASPAALASPLVPHRAVYDLALDTASERSGITGLTGRMVYEFNGSACEGYTTNFRFVTRIDMEEQPQRVTDQQTTTFEGADGKNFRFVNKTFVDIHQETGGYEREWMPGHRTTRSAGEAAPAQLPAVCPTCFVQLPASGRCDECA